MKENYKCKRTEEFFTSYPHSWNSLPISRACTLTLHPIPPTALLETPHCPKLHRQMVLKSTAGTCVCCAQPHPTLCDPMDCSLRGSSVHGDSPGKNTGVGCHALLQGIFPTQGLNPGLPHCRWILYCLGHHLNTVKSGWSGLERQLYKDPQAPVQAWGTQQGFIIIK